MSAVRILMLGDIVGRTGRDAVSQTLPGLIERHEPSFVIVNGENAAGGMGITPDIAKALLRQGVDAITLGNHAWRQSEISAYLDRESRLIRPANYPPGSPGRGWHVHQARGGASVGVVNLLGRIFMEPLDDPFQGINRALDEILPRTPVVFVDFHGEATSEKAAFGYYVDGRVSAVIGTHTHVQTADERILSGGTAFLTDVGMVGPQDSVIGMQSAIVVQRYVTQLPHRLEVADGPAVLCGVVVDVDAVTGHATSIERIQIRDIQ